MNTGGLYQRHMNEPILNSVIAGDIDSVKAQMEKPGGRIFMPKEKIAGVGPVVMIQDTQGKSIGLWKPEMK
jgi:predicted enzyme related to lactoylglutathione lyase